MRSTEDIVGVHDTALCLRDNHLRLDKNAQELQVQQSLT